MRELIGSQSAAVALTELTGERYEKFTETLRELGSVSGDTARAIERSKTSSEGFGRIFNELKLSSKEMFGAFIEGIDSLGPGTLGLFDAWANILRDVREAVTPLTDSAKELKGAMLDVAEAAELFRAAETANDVNAMATAHESSMPWRCP